MLGADWTQEPMPYLFKSFADLENLMFLNLLEIYHCCSTGRLNTIMDSNRVLVLDQGQIAEMASPEALLADKTSIFYGMAKNAGIAD